MRVLADLLLALLHARGALFRFLALQGECSLIREKLAHLLLQALLVAFLAFLAREALLALLGLLLAPLLLLRSSIAPLAFSEALLIVLTPEYFFFTMQHSVPPSLLSLRGWSTRPSKPDLSSWLGVRSFDPTSARAARVRAASNEGLRFYLTPHVSALHMCGTNSQLVDSARGPCVRRIPLSRSSASGGASPG